MSPAVVKYDLYHFPSFQEFHTLLQLEVYRRLVGQIFISLESYPDSVSEILFVREPQSLAILQNALVKFQNSLSAHRDLSKLSESPECVRNVITFWIEVHRM